jgi:hypothetical protein
MSNHLGRIFSYFVSSLFREPLYKKEVAANLGGLTLLTGIHAAYALSTEKTEEIQISRTYKMTRHGFTEFMVVDKKGRHFNVNNSLWYWKWDSVEEWERVKKDDSLSIQYYGWRKPVFGLFPNIVHVKKL